MARRLAEELGYLYVDTGAIYRTVALAVSRAGAETAEEISACLPDIRVNIDYGADGLQHMLLGNEDVTGEIRRPEVSMGASKVAALPAVRAFLLDRQRELARSRNVIMDGRDIGTVVLPDATVKIFLTASPEERAERRYLELRERGEAASYEQVLTDVIARDKQDSNRPIAPLRQAPDAQLVDTTGIPLEECCRLLTELVKERVGCE